MNTKNNWTIPNFLSGYRLLSFPLGIYLLVTKLEYAFAILIVINLVTDILDGYIARRFNLQTELGARLDSIADIGTYLLAFGGIYFFKLQEFQPHLISILLFLGLFLSANLLAIFKFGRTASLHLYSSKIGGYIQGIFFLVLFVWGFYTPFYYFMITWGIISFIEHISVQLYLNELRSNIKGIYWVIKTN